MNGSWTSYAYCTIAPSTLSAPNLLQPINNATVDRDADGKVTLSWSQVSGNNGYQIQIDELPIMDMVPNQTSYPAALDEGRHKWRVRTIISSGNYGSWSSCSYFICRHDDNLFPKTEVQTKNTDSLYGNNLNAFKNYKGQCTWYVYARVIELVDLGYFDESISVSLYNAFWGKTGRHAKNWPTFLGGDWICTQDEALSLDKRKRGLIAVWPGGTYGHVGFVEEISIDKQKYRLSDFNRSGKEQYLDKWYDFEGNDDFLVNSYPCFFDLNPISNGQENQPPYFDNAFLPSSVQYPKSVSFSGYVKDDEEINQISMMVTGPSGNYEVFSNSINTNSIPLDSFNFDSSLDYASQEGVYTITLSVIDNYGNIESKDFKITLFFDELEPPILSITPGELVPIGTDVTLSWSQISNAVGYKLYYGVTSKDYIDYIDYLDFQSENSLSFKVDEVDLFISIKAYDEFGGESPYSNELHLKNSKTEPLVCDPLVATPITGAPPLEVSFQVNVTGGVPPYTYQWNFGDEDASINSEYASHTYFDTGIFNASVTIVDSNGDTASQYKNINVNYGSLETPELAIESREGLEVKFSWPVISGADGYTIYRAPYLSNGEIDVNNAEVLGSVTQNEYTYVLWEKALVYVAIQAYNSTTQSPISNIIEVVIPSFNQENFLSLFSNEMYLEGADHESVYARIINLQNNTIEAKNDLDRFLKDSANPNGAIKSEGQIIISHWLDNTWQDNLDFNSSFNTVYDASPGKDSSGIFEVVSVTDESGSTRTTSNANAYYFSYDGLNDWNDGAVTIEQWIDYLARISEHYERIGRLTIFAHGWKGNVRMSDSFKLTTESLKEDSATKNQLMRLRNILAPNAHILLFSCNVGKYTKGANFVQELANLTGATVHANDVYTGDEDSTWFKKSDWSLNVVASPKNTNPDTNLDLSDILSHENFGIALEVLKACFILKEAQDALKLLEGLKQGLLIYEYLDGLGAYSGNTERALYTLEFILRNNANPFLKGLIPEGSILDAYMLEKDRVTAMAEINGECFNFNVKVKESRPFFLGSYGVKGATVKLHQISYYDNGRYITNSKNDQPVILGKEFGYFAGHYSFGFIKSGLYLIEVTKDNITKITTATVKVTDSQTETLYLDK